jgi:hypothetical protein
MLPARRGETGVQAPSLPESLVLHDGELGDVCALLDRLGLFFTERRGNARGDDAAQRWDLVIATPRHMLEFRPTAPGSSPVRIAVLDRDSKTLRSMLQRAGIDMVVRRPVHPAALRLLVLHCLYRGPERRRSPRVSVGAPVSFRTGLRRREAILADLSLTGGRLLCRYELERGQKLSLRIPTERGRGRLLRIDAEVLRVGPSEVEGMNSVALSFAPGSRRALERLREVVKRYAGGPAVLSGEAPPPVDELRIDGPPGSGVGASAEGGEDAERRDSPRREYVQHVIALGTEAGKVLVGRDISIGGMRVDPHPELLLGDELQIGLHLRAREKPVVVNARVARNDGERGLVLHFHGLSEAAASQLRSMVNLLPILAVRPPGGEETGLVLTEILDRRSAAHG